MLVWRMEYPDGGGAYQNRWEWPEEDRPSYLRDMYRRWADRGEEDPHPAPYEDGLGGYTRSEEFFGCSTPEQVLAWFFRDGREDARRYSSKGMRIILFEVRKKFVRKGGRQCVFVKRKARMVGRWEPSEFLVHFGPREASEWVTTFSQEKLGEFPTFKAVSELRLV
ncbi:hypothetical protein SEA_EDEN_47 [Microbacterium phage Eden]|uniref:Uncharacterized protein n=1 Tax=Microbacterium phage Eden TaxID=2250289 RepID=A0A345KWE0_9CAUD|nr:hypothetical protein HOT71_gp47 [Microbacterium phage Eden]AXH47342.1 hypothetical protein SEA_EDEN_47 [Microbacterium phage Eden]